VRPDCPEWPGCGCFVRGTAGENCPALVGEAGPETVVPAARLAALGGTDPGATAPGRSRRDAVTEVPNASDLSRAQWCRLLGAMDDARWEGWNSAERASKYRASEWTRSQLHAKVLRRVLNGERVPDRAEWLGEKA